MTRRAVTYTVHSFDSAGNTDVMTASVADDTWTFEGKSLRFRGAFVTAARAWLACGTDGRTMGRRWEHLMDVKLSKVQ